MVARDPIRKVTLDPRNADDPHVGSKVNIADPVKVEQTGTVSGTSSADVKPEKKSSKKDA